MLTIPSPSRSPMFTCKTPSLSLTFSAMTNLPKPKTFKPLFFSSRAATPPSDEPSPDIVEQLLTNRDLIRGLMKMDRRSDPEKAVGRWFPYLDLCTIGSASLTSREIVEVLQPFILDARKEKIRRVVDNRSYSVSLVVEGLTDLGNVSAAFRSADALGIQSVHVVSSGARKRYRDNRHVSMGAEKWLDIELWKSPRDCFQALRRRGYRIATTHLGDDTVSIYDLNWSLPTAIVIGNEHGGISNEAVQLADLRCSIPMMGMVDSFNVSVAAGILIHHAVYDRFSRLGRHGDLTCEEREVLQAEFFLRHRKSTMTVVNEYAKRMLGVSLSKEVLL